MVTAMATGMDSNRKISEKYLYRVTILFSALTQHDSLTYLSAVTFKTMIMAKEKVNYQEVYDLYQLCSESKGPWEFCADYGVNYNKFMNWQRHQLWNEKLGKAVQAEQPKVAKVQITSKPCNSPTIKMEVKQPEGEPPIKWVKLQLSSGAALFLRNTMVLDLCLFLQTGQRWT